MASGFRVLDKNVCVHCARVWFVRSVGKGSRTFMVECDPSCEKEVAGGVSTANEPAGKPKAVPAR